MTDYGRHFKAIDVVLTREQGGSALRTDSVTGWCVDMPKVGRQFVMYGNSLEPGGAFRWVRTSPVELVEQVGDAVTFTTESGSIYRLEIVPVGAGR